jgi:hypothetical protein
MNLNKKIKTWFEWEKKTFQDDVVFSLFKKKKNWGDHVVNRNGLA